MLQREAINSKPEIISVHIPKTAGTTFGQILAQVYGDAQVLFDNPQLDRVGELPIIEPHIRAIHGHFPVGKYAGHFPWAKRIVWLRHPIDRLLSHYFFLKSFSMVHNDDPIHHLVLEKQISVVEFAQQVGMFNVLAGFTYGLPLTDFYFVGIQEFLMEDLAELKAMLGWCEFGVAMFNSNPNKEYSQGCTKLLTDRKILIELESILKPEIEIYESALRLREKRKG
jgi:Sulfotransferase family